METKDESLLLQPRLFTPEEVKARDGKNGNEFWCVVDGLVTDASDFLDSHPGGLKKLLATDDPKIGATGDFFGFSFARGKNSHYAETAKTFADGVERFFGNQSNIHQEKHLPSETVVFESGKLIILGKLSVQT